MTTYVGEDAFGAISAWPLNGNSTDETGANNGTDSNMSYSASNTKFVQHGVFNGTSSRISIGSNASMKPTSFTSSCWVYPNSPTGNAAILSTWSLSGLKYYGWSFDFMSTRKVRLLVANGTGTTVNTHYRELLSTSTLSDTTWSHIATTYDGTNMKVFINGRQDGSSTFSLVYLATTLNMIGCKQGAAASYSDYLKGNVDNLKLYGRVLSEAEIRKLYAWETGRLL